MLLDGINVRVRAGQQHLVNLVLFSANATNTLAQNVAVLLKRTSDNGLQTFTEIARCLRVDVLHEVAALVVPGECGFHTSYLERTHRSQDLDQELLIGAEALHGFTQSVRCLSHVHVRHLTRGVTGTWSRWRA